MIGSGISSSSKKTSELRANPNYGNYPSHIKSFAKRRDFCSGRLGASNPLVLASSSNKVLPFWRLGALREKLSVQG